MSVLSDLTTWGNQELLDHLKRMTEMIHASLAPDATNDARWVGVSAMGEIAEISRLLNVRVPDLKAQIADIIAEVAGPKQALVAEIEQAETAARGAIRSVFLRDEGDKHLAGWVFKEARDYKVVLPPEDTPEYQRLLAYLEQDHPQTLKTTIKVREFNQAAKSFSKELLRDLGVTLERPSHVALEPIGKPS